MENFFDLATPEEITGNFSIDDTPLSAEEIAAERRSLEQDSDRNLEYLAYLFVGRDEFARADQCVEAIQDDMRRADTARMLTHWEGYYDYMSEKHKKMP